MSYTEVLVNPELTYPSQFSFETNREEQDAFNKEIFYDFFNLLLQTRFGQTLFLELAVLQQ